MVGVPGVERGRQCDKWRGLWGLQKAGRQPSRFDKRVGNHTGPGLRLRLTQQVPTPEIAGKCVHGNRNARAKETEQARCPRGPRVTVQIMIDSQSKIGVNGHETGTWVSASERAFAVRHRRGGARNSSHLGGARRKVGRIATHLHRQLSAYRPGPGRTRRDQDGVGEDEPQRLEGRPLKTPP
jgi:hypothetical protein